jgi:hypothetical protein
MTKNSTKKLDLSKYTAVAGAVVAAGSVNAQIVYTDVNPDVVVDVNSGIVGLDFNNDATDDLGFAVQNQAGTATYSTFTYQYDINFALVAGSVMGMSSSSSFAVTALNNGDAIGAAGQFNNASAGSILGGFGPLTIPAFSYTTDYTAGNFLGAVDKFVGTKFTAGANTHYGWVRVDVAADASTITIKDHAFNATPNGTINAGQMAGLENFAVENKVTIKTTLEEAMINVTPDLIGGSLVITDMAGKEVKSALINDINAKISYTGLNTGVYFVEARFESGSVNKKVYVK